MIQIRRLEEKDAEAVSALISETMRISNSRDYPPELLRGMPPEKVIERSGWTHFYVAEDGEELVGCGAIGPYWGKTDESSLFTIFVRPDRQGQGVGRRIVETLEADEFALRAKRIEIPASITGLPFYQKMGYAFKPGCEEPDEELIYRLEKYR